MIVRQNEWEEGGTEREQTNKTKTVHSSMLVYIEKSNRIRSGADCSEHKAKEKHIKINNENDRINAEGYV